MKIKGIHRRQNPTSRATREPDRHNETSTSTEIEIKFEVPDGALENLLHEMSGPASTQRTLRAIYYDVPGSKLSRAGIALRVRYDGRHWVQTLKAPGAHALGRVEDEVVLEHDGPEDAPPSADLRRHRNSAVQLVIRRALGLRRGAHVPAVEPVFEVPVTRRTRRVAEGASIIELALDQGRIQAAGRSRPIREFELELVEGNMADLLVLARRYRERWDLCLNSASKARRGFSLASGNLYGPPAGAGGLSLPAKPTMGEFTTAVLDSCLRQVIDNASEVAAGSQGEEHIHQLRVGLRRLRTALRELPVPAEELGRIEPVLVSVFRGLGERRDRTYVLRQIQPLVEAAGGSPLRVPPGFHEASDPGELVRANDFQEALLSLLLCAEQARMNADKGVRHRLRGLLGRLHKQVARDGARFTELSTDRQHRVRKRLKRLRYLSEFAEPLYARKRVARYLDALKPAQDALGEYNDGIMAQALYEELLGSDPGARFGVDWLQSRRANNAKSCRKVLRKLKSRNVFWKKS